MQRRDDYGSEGECIMAVAETRQAERETCPLRQHYIQNGVDPFKRSNWQSTVGLIIQTVVFLVSLAGFVRYLEKRIDALDGHLIATAKGLQNHVYYDHTLMDRSKRALHNNCKDAMDKGCHPSAQTAIPYPDIVPRYSPTPPGITQ